MIRRTLFTFILILSQASNSLSQESVVDEVVATVNGQPIMLSDVKESMGSAGAGITKKNLVVGSTANAALDRLILRRLVMAEADSKRVNVTNADVENYINEVKKKNGLSDETLARELKKAGKTMASYKDEIQLEITRARLANAYAKGNVTVSQDDAEKFLKENHPKSTRLHLVRESLPKEQITLEIAAVIREKMVDGRSVKGIEEDNNITGIETDFGFVEEKDLAPDIVKAIKNLDEDEYSIIIETENSWDFYKVTDKEEPEPYSEADYDDARRALKNTKTESALTDYFLTELPKKYPVERK